MQELKFMIENASRTFLTVKLKTKVIQLRVGEISKPYPEAEMTATLKVSKDVRIRPVYVSVADGKKPGDDRETGKVDIKKAGKK
jgi:hypothetical protein